MMEPVEHFARAPYYDGRGFPVDALSPAEFENFVFGCLLCIQDVLGLKLTGKPSGSGDGGFDLLGQVTSTKRLACVQCKRQKDPLGASQAAEELAKVAATMALESSDVGEHRFICTGGVRQELVHQLREKPRQQLALEASERLANAKEGELFSLRERLCQLGVDPREVAKDYVLRLDVLTAWGLEEFDSSLSPRWSDVLQVAERYFRIATVVREYPRAAFDRSGYSAEQRAFRLPVEPRLVDSSLPEGITASSAANPNATPSAPRRSDDALTALETLTPGELALLVGDGGVGKSAVLELVRANLLRAPRDSTLPVIIPLANYSPGSLDRAIHQELGVDHGTWRSLPDRMLLLCDGLNECPSVTVAAFLEEVKPLLKRRRIACVISTREATRHKNIVLPQPPAVCAKVQCITPIGIPTVPASVTDAFRRRARLA